ncbi:hypothetical protein FRC00_007929, partial [Tulasnella sp. 408]
MPHERESVGVLRTSTRPPSKSGSTFHESPPDLQTEVAPELPSIIPAEHQIDFIMAGLGDSDVQPVMFGHGGTLAVIKIYETRKHEPTQAQKFRRG